MDLLCGRGYGVEGCKRLPTPSLSHHVVKGSEHTLVLSNLRSCVLCTWSAGVCVCVCVCVCVRQVSCTCGLFTQPFLPFFRARKDERVCNVMQRHVTSQPPLGFVLQTPSVPSREPRGESEAIQGVGVTRGKERAGPRAHVDGEYRLFVQILVQACAPHRRRGPVTGPCVHMLRYLGSI